MVSIIVPVYNTEVRYLKTCISSLINQSVHDFEILIIDDGSQSATAKACDEMAALDARVKVLHKPNGGVSSARNLGLENAAGEYVAFVDSDDWAEPDFLELLLAGYQNSSVQLSIVGIAHEDGSQTSPLDFAAAGERSAEIFTQETLFTQLLTSPQVGGFLCNKLFKRARITAKLDEDLHYSEDFVFTATYAKSVENAAFSSKQAYHYRQWQGNATSGSGYDNKIFSLLSAYKTLEIIYSECSPSSLPTIKRNILKIALNLRARYKFHKENNPRQYQQIQETIRGYWREVMRSRQVGISTKINIIMTFLFPTLLFQIKNKLLGRKL